MDATKLIGQLGEFTDRDGIVRQCRVTGLADDEGIPEFKDLLTIDYCRDGELIKGVFIHAREFTPV